jgi:hypothetical protein
MSFLWPYYTMHLVALSLMAKMLVVGSTQLFLMTKWGDDEEKKKRKWIWQNGKVNNMLKVRLPRRWDFNGRTKYLDLAWWREANDAISWYSQFDQNLRTKTSVFIQTAADFMKPTSATGEPIVHPPEYWRDNKFEGSLLSAYEIVDYMRNKFAPLDLKGDEAAQLSEFERGVGLFTGMRFVVSSKDTGELDEKFKQQVKNDMAYNRLVEAQISEIAKNNPAKLKKMLAEGKVTPQQYIKAQLGTMPAMNQLDVLKQYIAGQRKIAQRGGKKDAVPWT